MKPTVSVRRTFLPESSMARVVVDKVVNKPESTGTTSLARALKSELLPAFV